MNRFGPKLGGMFLAFGLVFSMLFANVHLAIASSPNVVISQIYGGGGNSGATYKNDFIELFNTGSSPVSLNGWSVQYASSTGSTWQVTNLTNVNLQPGQYYLVQEAAGSGGTVNLPTPDATGAIPMSGTGGKVALVSSTTALSGTCPTGGSLVDFIGFGTTANCYETALAPAPSNTTADIRTSGGCSDTDNNSADFSTGTPNPRNSSTYHTCTNSPYLTVSDVSSYEGNSGTTTFTFVVTLSDPAPAGGVTFDIATADGTAAEPGDYTAVSLTNQTIPEGSTTYNFDVLVNGDADTESDETFYVNVTNVSGGTILDSQGAGTIQNDDAVVPDLSIDDVSLNEGDSGTTTFTFTVSLSVAAPVGGVTFDITTADGTAAEPGDYTAVSLSGQTIAASNLTSTFDVLVNGDTTYDPDETFYVNVTNVTGANVVDGQGLGTILNDDAMPIGTVNGAVLDTDNGATHTSPYVGQTVLVRGVIYEKTLQAISNSANTYKGFFIQNTASTADGDPNTSDGLFVFMSTNSTFSSYTPTVGDEIILTGKISEYYNMTELTNPALVAVVRSGADLDAELPAFVADPPSNLGDANRYWERRQAMRGQVPADSIVLNGRNVFNPADAEIWLARSDSVIAGRADPFERRAFRDAHPLDDNYDADTWDGNGYRFLMGSLGIKGTLNDAQALLNPARTFDVVTNAPVGGVNYSFNKYRIEVTDQPVLNDGVDPSTNNPPSVFDRGLAYSIADYNLENLYDYRDNPFSGCDFTGNSGCPKVSPFLAAVTSPFDYVPASDDAYQARLGDIAQQIINDLHSPDILMVQEVENQDICTVTGGALVCGSVDNADGKPDVLQELALKIAELGGPAYDAAFDRDSSDLRGILPAFLYRTDRVKLVDPTDDPVLGTTPVIGSYTSVAYDSDVSNPKTLNAVYTGSGACETSWVFPRAPDVALFRIYTTSVDVGAYRDVYVIDNHFKSGPDSCVSHRTEQANFNAALVQYIEATNPNARIVLGGDLNVYPRPDDPFAPIGQPSSSDQLGALYDPALGLTNLWDVLVSQAPESAYSYDYVGMAQTLDQMFINSTMQTDLLQYRVAHINSDFTADYPDDVARGTSDHDPQVAVFYATPFVTETTITADTPDPSYPGQTVSVTASVAGLPAGAPTPTGTVTISGGDADCTINLVNGTGSCDITFSVGGTPTITATYNPDTNFLTSSDTESHVVDGTRPGLLSPLDGAVLHDNHPTFDWIDFAGATKYQIQVSKNIKFSSLVLNKVTTTSYSTANVPAHTLLYWRVRAWVGSKYTPWSEVWTLTTANPPSVPGLLAPKLNALVGVTPLFDWSDSKVPSGVTFDHYQIQVATDSAFANKVHDADIFGRTNSQDGSAVLDPGLTYYWRVRAFADNGDMSNWSKVYSLRTALPAPVLLDPADGSSVSGLRPIFTWNGVVGASKYQIQISKSASFGFGTISAAISTPTYTPGINLNKHTTYYWRVRVLGTYASDWSLVFSFTTP